MLSTPQLHLLLSRSNDTTDDAWLESTISAIQQNPGDALRKRDESGHLAIHVACLKGHVEIARVLLEMDSNLAHAASSVSGYLPMHCGAHGGHLEVVRLLLTVTPQSRDVRARGNLPEDIAAKYGFHEVEALLRSIDAVLPSSPSSSLRHFAKLPAVEPDLSRRDNAPVPLDECEAAVSAPDSGLHPETEAVVGIGEAPAGEGIRGSALQLCGRDELSPRSVAITYPSTSTLKTRIKKPSPQSAVIETTRWPVGPEGDDPLQPAAAVPVVSMLAPAPAPTPAQALITPRAAEAQMQALRRAALEQQQHQRRAAPKVAVPQTKLELGTSPTHRVPRPMASDGCTAFSPRLWAFYSSLERALSQGPGLVGINHPDPNLGAKLRYVYDDFIGGSSMSMSSSSSRAQRAVGTATLQSSLPSSPSFPSLPGCTVSELSEFAPSLVLSAHPSPHRSPVSSPAESRSWRADVAPRPESGPESEQIIQFWNDCEEQTGTFLGDEDDYEDQDSLCSDGLSRGFLRYLMSSENLTRYIALSPEDAREEGAWGATQRPSPRGTKPSTQSPSRRPVVAKRPPALRLGVALAISTQAVGLPDTAVYAPLLSPRSALPPGRTKPHKAALLTSKPKLGEEQGAISIVVPPSTLPPPSPASPRKKSCSFAPRPQVDMDEQVASGLQNTNQAPSASLPPPRTDYASNQHVFPVSKNIFS